MGTFAYSMFSGMLSWFRTAVNWLWNTLVSQENGGLLAWVGQNWLGLIAVLCAICLAVDALVHLLRWRPDKVWASFFRRMFSRASSQDTAGFASARMRREWHYADGTARTEEVEVPQEDWPPEELPPTPVSELPPQYVQGFSRPENLKYQEEMKKEQPEGLEDYPQPMQPRRRRVEAAGTERLQKRMTRLHTRTDETDGMALRYRPAPPAVDKREAYHEPYIPPQWKRPGDVGASQEEDEGEHAY